MPRLREYMSPQVYLYHGMMLLGETSWPDAQSRVSQSCAYFRIVERVSRSDVAGALFVGAWRKERSIWS